MEFGLHVICYVHSAVQCILYVMSSAFPLERCYQLVFFESIVLLWFSISGVV